MATGLRGGVWTRRGVAEAEANQDEEYRAFPDAARRNAWQEWFEVRALARALRLPRGRRVLEVGCGRGVALPVLADALRPSRLVGLDADGALLEEASARLARKRRAAELVAADVRDMPFADGAFEIVIDFGTCYHVARCECALREIARVLSPNGLFVHETPACQLLSHPRRSRGRRLPWRAVPELVPARHAALWAARVRTVAAALALALVFGVAAHPSEGPAPPAAPVAPADAAAPDRTAGAAAPAAAGSAPAEPAVATRANGPEMGTRLFFAPTARSLRRGAAAAGLTEIAFPWVEAGIGDRFSLLVVGLPPLEGLVSPGVVIGPKFQLFRRERVQVAAGVLHALSAGAAGGVGYGAVTIGGPRTAATVGLGYGYGGWDSSGSRALVYVGFDHALARRVRVVLEGWIGGAGLGLPDRTLVAAMRLGRRWSFDLGVLVPVYETGSGTPVPVLTIARRF